MMSLGDRYQGFYDLICGKHPYQRPWHFQWLPARRLRTEIKNTLVIIEGKTSVLDVGCGSSPYRRWLPRGCSYTGMDIEGSGDAVDITIKPDEPWPLGNESHDVVLCTEVLEHVRDQSLLLGEINRVLRPGGILILTAPFIYNEHGRPWDYRRFSAYGLEELMKAAYRTESIRRLGRIGTVGGTLFLNWIDESFTQTKVLLYLKPALLPLWLPFCLIVNGLCAGLDTFDHTRGYYIDTLLVASKR